MAYSRSRPGGVGKMDASFVWVVALVCLGSCFIQSSFGKVIRPSSNPNYDNAASDANSTTQPFTIYETTTVFLHARDNVTGHEWKATFWPRVDEFSVLEIAGSYQNNMIFNPNLSVWIEFQDRKLTPKRVYQNENELFITYFTAVVLLDHGWVTDLEWQDGCSGSAGCASKYCLDESCGTFRRNKGDDVCDKMDCNIKVYFAFSGRDKNDNACKSIASTPAKFAKYSATPLRNFGSSLWDDFIWTFTSSAPNPISEQA